MGFDTLSCKDSHLHVKSSVLISLQKKNPDTKFYCASYTINGHMVLLGIANAHKQMHRHRAETRVAGMPQCDVWSPTPPPPPQRAISSSASDRGNEHWGIYLPCWHCFCLVSSELTHLLKCRLETFTYYRAGLLSRDCALRVSLKRKIEMKAAD